jgi:uncharacterized DUF497 family protein
MIPTFDVIRTFEWDLEKAQLNFSKHGVTFEEAATVFGDFDADIEDDLDHSRNEDRLIIIGMSARERILLTVYTIRHKDTVRIISSRRAEPSERETYENKIRHT